MIVRLLVAMLEPVSGAVFDRCCGSGGMFVQSDLFTKHSGRLTCYGQESKDFTYRLCRNNRFIQGIDGKIELGNSYWDDRHAGLKADYILAKPPFHEGWKGENGWGADRVPDKEPHLTIGAANCESRMRRTSGGEVARHEAICELRSGEPTLVAPCREDVALARVTNPEVVCSWQGDAGGYDTPRVVHPLASGLRVKKFGRTTGLTTGTVEALIPTPTPIPYKAKFFAATVWLQDVWTVRADPGTAFALPGDSGSLVVTEDGEASVGILFAAQAQGDYGWVIPMTHVVTLFGGITLVEKHGV